MTTEIIQFTDEQTWLANRRLVFALADYGAALIFAAGLTALALEYFGVPTQ